MSESELFIRSLWSVVGIFGAGGVLILILGHFDLKRIIQGELGARYIGWLILTPIYGLAVFTERAIGTSLILIGMVIAIIEYSRAAGIYRSQQIYLYIFAGITVLVVLLKPGLFAALPVLVILLLTTIPILTNDPQRLHGRIRLVSWGYMYTVWSLAHGLLIFKLPDGKGVLLVIIVGCALADIGAYVVGKAIGRTIIAPEINPNKAWEGMLGDLLGAAIAVIIFLFIIPSYGLPALIGLVVIIGIGSSWGDILSSLAKRSADIKDWGSLIPGHGGLLDRLNSLLVVMPLTYYYLVLILPAQ